MKGGENLGDEESSEEEKKVTRLDSNAGSKVPCSRRCFYAFVQPLYTAIHCEEKRAQS